MAIHSSTLAWKIPWTEEPGRLQSMGLLRVGHDWATSLSLVTFMHWSRKWQPTPMFLPGESQGRGAWWASVYGVAQSRTRLKWLSSSSRSNSYNIKWEFPFDPTIPVLKFYLFYFNFIVLVLPYIKMNPPQIYMCSSSWTLLPPSLPIPSLWVVPVHQPQVSSIVHRTWTGNSFHIWYYTCFNAILPNHPTLSLCHRVQKTVLYMSVSFAVSYTGLLLPSF